MRSIPSAAARSLWITASLLLLPAARAAALCTGIVCPANITVSNDPNQCGAVATYGAPTAVVVGGAPGCGTITCGPGSGSFFPRGTTEVGCASSAGPTCTLNVTVNDTQPPQISVSSNLALFAPTPGESTIVNFPPPVASDNCPGITVACDPPAGSAFPSGESTVTCTAEDGVGNTATGSFEISYFDACVQDDAGGEFLRWRTADGVYQFVDCAVSGCGTGGILERLGDGEATPTAAGFVLKDVQDDLAIRATVRTGTGKGNARIKLLAGSTKITAKLKDSDFADDPCSCP